MAAQEMLTDSSDNLATAQKMMAHSVGPVQPADMIALGHAQADHASACIDLARLL